MRQDRLPGSLRRGGRCLKRQSSGGGVGTILSNVLKKRSCISRTAPRLLCTLEPGTETLIPVKPLSPARHCPARLGSAMGAPGRRGAERGGGKWPPAGRRWLRAAGSGRSGLRNRPAPLRVPQRPPLPSRSPPAAPRPAPEPLGWSPPHGGAPSFVCCAGLTGCEGQVPAGGCGGGREMGFGLKREAFRLGGALLGVTALDPLVVRGNPGL